MFRRNFLSAGLASFVGSLGFIPKNAVRSKEQITYLGEEVYYSIDGKIVKKQTSEVVRWFNDEGELHRIDGPAIEFADGGKRWLLNGQWHRVGGPAVECASGDKYWYLNGKLHRVDGPAIEFASGHKEWYFNGQWHRIDGSKHWYLDGKRHRVDGPAVEYADGRKEWYLNGIEQEGGNV